MSDPIALTPEQQALLLAEAQCTKSEICAALVRRLSMSRQDAAALVHSMADDLEDAQRDGRAGLRQHLWALASMPNALGAKVAECLAYQHLGWTREGFDAKVRKAAEQAEKGHFNAKLKAVG